MGNVESYEQPPPTPMQRNPTSGLLALIMGILGFSALPLIGSVLAVVFGYQSRREAAVHPQFYVDDLGKAGRILGWVGIGLAALMVVVALAFFLFLIPFGLTISPS